MSVEASDRGIEGGDPGLMLGFSLNMTRMRVTIWGGMMG